MAAFHSSTLAATPSEDCMYQSWLLDVGQLYTNVFQYWQPIVNCILYTFSSLNIFLFSLILLICFPPSNIVLVIGDSYVRRASQSAAETTSACRASVSAGLSVVDCGGKALLPLLYHLPARQNSSGCPPRPLWRQQNVFWMCFLIS